MISSLVLNPNLFLLHPEIIKVIDKIIVNFEVLGTISAEYQSFLVSLKRLNKLGNNQAISES